MGKLGTVLKKYEKGSVVVFFAFGLVILLGFVSLAIDVGMVNMKKARMMDVCQQMRKARIDAKDYILNASDPGALIYDISNRCAIENNFEGNLKIYYSEKTDPASTSSNWVDKRGYQVRIELQQEHRFAFAMGIFVGSAPQTITVSLDGSELKTSTGDKNIGKIPVWYPGHKRNGSYSRTDLLGVGACHYNAADLPSGW